MDTARVGAQLNTGIRDLLVNEQAESYVCDLPSSLFVDGRNIKMGDRLVFGIAGVNKQYNARLVGAVPSKHVMLVIENDNIDSSILLIGLDIYCCHVSNESFLTFKSKVVKSSETPFSYILIEYPTEIKRLSAKRDVRFDVDLVALLHVLTGTQKKERLVTAKLLNIGSGGVLATTIEPVCMVGDEVEIELSLPCIEMNVDLKLDARVKTVSDETDVKGRVRFRYLQDLTHGDALQQIALDRKLILLRDTVGVGSVSATLQPAAIAGASDLLVDITPSAPYNFGVQLDNYGNRYTGENRLGGYFALNNPLQLGDQLTVRAIGTYSNMSYGQVTYQLPLGGNGWRLGASYYYMQYQLGREFELLDAYGTSRGSSVFASYPFVLNQMGSLVGSLTYENRSLIDNVDSTSTNSDKQVKLINLGIIGNYQDMLNGAGLSSFGLSLIAGQLTMDAVSRAVDDKTARSNGAFTKATYTFNRLQRLTSNDAFAFNLIGQWAGDNLNSSDKYSLGGPNGVRAYPQGEASGDEGYVLNFELRHRFTPKLQASVFYDYGHIKINHDSYAAGPNTSSIAGAGVGLGVEIFRHLQLNSYVAWSTQGDTPSSEPASAERNFRLWMQLSSNF